MNFVALRMLVGDRAKYLGIIVGVTFASLLLLPALWVLPRQEAEGAPRSVWRTRYRD